MTDDTELRLTFLQGVVEYLCVNMIAHSRSVDEAKTEALRLSKGSLDGLKTLSADDDLLKKVGQIEAQFWSGVVSRLDALHDASGATE
jgi:hypothetical protein